MMWPLSVSPSGDLSGPHALPPLKHKIDYEMGAAGSLWPYLKGEHALMQYNRDLVKDLTQAIYNTMYYGMLAPVELTHGHQFPAPQGGDIFSPTESSVCRQVLGVGLEDLGTKLLGSHHLMPRFFYRWMDYL